MPFFGSMPFGGRQFQLPQANPVQSGMAAFKPADVVAQALLGPLRGRETSGMGSAADRNAREREMMGRGFTDSLRGLGDILSNVATVATSPVTGLMGTAVNAGFKDLTGMDLGMGFKDVTGKRAYDADLVDAVGKGNMTRGEADRVQHERDAAKRGTAMSDSASRGHAGGNYGGGGMGSGASSRESRGV